MDALINMLGLYRHDMITLSELDDALTDYNRGCDYRFLTFGSLMEMPS